MTRVLVVDDDEAVRGMLRIILELRGYAVQLASSGRRALDVDISDYDVMLLDQMMPELSGVDVLARLPHGHPPVVALTANTSQAVARDLRRTGAVAVLTKPFHADDLVEILEQAHVNPPT